MEKCTSLDELIGSEVEASEAICHRIHLGEEFPDYYPEEQRLEDKKKLEERLGFKLEFEVLGVQVLVRVVIRNEEQILTDKDGREITNDRGEKVKIVLPDSARLLDRYSSNVGLVCDVGPEAFRSTKGKYSGPLYRIGDYIVFPPSAGLATPYKGLPFKVLLDEHAMIKTDKPEDFLIPIKQLSQC